MVADGDAAAGPAWTEEEHAPPAGVSAPLHEIMLADGTAAMVIRHCRRCDRDLPLSAFLPRKHVCNECRPPAECQPAPDDPYRRATTSLTQDPGYQHGLSAHLAGMQRVAVGSQCPNCRRTGVDLYKADDDGAAAVCLACLQAAQREQGHCVICGQPIVGRRANATTCGADCQREAHRRQCAEYYEQKKKAAVATPGQAAEAPPG